MNLLAGDSLTARDFHEAQARASKCSVTRPHARPAIVSSMPARAAAMAARALGTCAHFAAGPRLSILIFHRVLAAPDPLFPSEIDAQRFRRLMGLVRAGFRVMPLDEAVRGLAQGALPSHALAITFDDGYADNHDIAAPILHQLGLPATVFVASGHLDGGRMWNDSAIECVRRSTLSSIDLGFVGLPMVVPLGQVNERRSAIDRIISAVKHRDPGERERLVGDLHRICGQPRLPSDLMMTRGQVRSLAESGITIGAHTVSHPILKAVGDEQAELEIAGGRHELERIIDRPVTLFAYPNGRPGADYSNSHVEMVRRLGFAAAVSTASGHNGPGADPLQLRRFSPWDRSDAAWVGRLAWSHAWKPAS